MQNRYLCPNVGLDPTGIRVGQRWRNTINEGARRDTYTVTAEPDADGFVGLEAPRIVVRVSVGTLLAYWTCLDVPAMT